jgi:uncharacterized membrane protein YdfJ with MMPL/SSD domain
MTDIELVRGASRHVGRSLANLDGQTCLQVAQAHSKADIHAAQVDAVAAVAQRAMQGIAFVSQIEQQLGQVVPLAVSRLQAIGDITAMSLAQVVVDTANGVRGR